MLIHAILVAHIIVVGYWLGTTLGALLGYFPGGISLAGTATLSGIAWLVLVELTHRLRNGTTGRALGRIDRTIRYLAIATAMTIAVGTLTGYFSVAGWLAVKLALFAGVIVSGLGIRFELVHYFQVWHAIRVEGSTDEREKLLRSRYKSSTTILVLLWLFIATIVAVSVLKPSWS